ncbi:hypothetical protein BJX68DRAFT_128602 [Aspergillus pseudodeflectus]|uniref:cyclin-dependent kinase n=1 Tax=Aspergillus pseudodeflectus TaxID=176178 RepID=A0ABR4K0Z5_9EURO
MAGSRRSPVLRDEWRGAPEAGDQPGRDKHSRPRGSHRDRGRDRFRDRDRRRRPKDSRPDHSSRSPPSRSFSGPNDEPQHREVLDIDPHRGSPGPSHPENRTSQKSNRHTSPELKDYRGHESHMRIVDREFRREDSPAPASKRKRTRSPSPGPGHHPSNPRGPPSRQGEDFDRNWSHSKRRGRVPGRGRPSRRPSPRRGRDHRNSEGGRRDSSRLGHSRSPGWEEDPYLHPSRRPHSPYPEDDFGKGSRHRSPSRHSAGTMASRPSAFSRRGSRDDSTMYPSRSGMDSSHKSPSPSRQGSNQGADLGGPKARNPQRRRPSRSPANSYHGSTRSTSPYSAGRGGRSGQQPPPHGHHGSRQNHHSTNDSSTQYHHNQPPIKHSSHHDGLSHGYRDGPSRNRELGQGPGSERHFPASVPSGPASHGRGRFRSPQWDASDSRTRVAPPSPPPQGPPAESPPPPPPPPSEPRAHREAYKVSNYIPASRESRAGDEASKRETDNGGGQPEQSDTRPADTAAPSKGGKISFAFKAKTGPPSAPKPVPDLAQRMLAREPPPRVTEPPRSRMPSGPPPRIKPESRYDRRERDRDRHRDRDRNRGRGDRRDYREPRGFREPPREPRDSRRDERRFEPRHNDKRRNDRPPDVRPERPERRRERSPEPVKGPKIMLRPKPRPTISEEFAKSDSVYYRKPGNESVIGAGTYGKVFKAIHVYTQRKVALKKIRMEGEKDGFPVTAVREIKLLQHLRNHNVVSLLEVMVERNECFMVFEYLSHDLTGLINHPTFTLTAAHKKDLAKQMFEGLNYLHHRGVLHRDIKAANILISNQGQLKFADFGLARFFSKSRQLDYTNRVITIWYRPPELLLGETRYGPAVDVWSAACVYVEMFTKKAVFPGEGGEISQLDKLYHTLGTPTRAEWPDIIEMPWFELMRPTERRKRLFEDVYRDILSPAALDMISQVFRYDPSKRPTAEEVLAHPYFHSEEPTPQQPTELENIEGDWHEFESKALRKERDREARRAEYQKDKEKRKTVSSTQDERDPKRVKQDTGEGFTPAPQPVEQ